MDQNKLKRHHIMRSLILAGITALLAYLILSETLSHYLAPRLHMFSYVTLVIMGLLTIVSIRQIFVGSSVYDCDCEEQHKVPRTPMGSLLVYGLFVLPIVMGFVMPDKILGSDVVEKRGITLLSNDVRKLADVTANANANVNATENVEQTAEVKEDAEPIVEPQPEVTNQGATPPVQATNDEQLRQRFSNGGFGDFYTDIAVFLHKQPVIELNDKVFLDGLTTMELYAKEFAGKELETMGFVYRQPDFTKQQFVVARFSVTCCTADASVYGVLVEKEDANKWAKDSWVKVRGKLELRQVDGYDMLVLKASQVEAVSAPKDPYVYYSFESVPGS
ncbi:TIGR03943 family putative permease subunit [Brevibacillus porteri]|uniref:TIGR03943 family protein n=1 Tax=Brevibacillus porteri TaxID=2126350 RepID=A0ABX5FHJ8_9BACL|nr:TIGR03943 family protein [Brevibacillus porteri]MED1802393.1 TIGR03943 family protein [Brevibacillus porteri]MED2129575.1 TIGR03943 family protein [Brevibacillus porteri]MED2747516.1 TIGR03943 family protein [Brevibacillus porteri]MED2817023.1 TIGR03943 family protein [Brevibacillus porteri]MED2894900.1 TIGR03943 family protein [Brevibacillus porteri]